MATFPNAFKKVFVSTGALAAANKKTKDLAAGELALVDPNTNTAIDPTTLAASGNFPRQAYLALGSYHTSDRIGVHGGYKESIKSKGINPRYVTKFWKVTPQAAQNQIVRVGFDQTNGNTNPTFIEGQTYRLRLDLKGSPVLRFLGRNAYKTLDGFAGIPANPANPVAIASGKVLGQMVNQIIADPILSAFVKASLEITDTNNVVTTLTDPTAIAAYAGPTTDKAAIRLEVIYSATSFANDSFSQFDHVEKEPVVITTAQLVDESGDPGSGFVQIAFTEVQPIILPQGLGEDLIRDLILFKQYLIEPFQTDNRKRQIEHDPTFGTVDRTKSYKHYFILHSVPRFMNPSSTFDNDQYLIQLSFESTVNTAAIETFLTEFIKSGNQGVVLRDHS